MGYTEEFTEVHDILAALAPTTANGTAAAHATPFVSMADYHRAFVLLHVGEPGAGGSTIDVALQQSKTVGGSGPIKALTNIAGGSKSPAQIINTDAGNYVGIEIRATELDATNQYDFIRAIVTVGTNTYTYSLYILGIVSRYEAVGITDFQEVVH